MILISKDNIDEEILKNEQMMLWHNENAKKLRVKSNQIYDGIEKICQDYEDNKNK
jgi:hypothetical protein